VITASAKAHSCIEKPKQKCHLKILPNQQ